MGNSSFPRNSWAILKIPLNINLNSVGIWWFPRDFAETSLRFPPIRPSISLFNIFLKPAKVVWANRGVAPNVGLNGIPGIPGLRSSWTLCGEPRLERSNANEQISMSRRLAHVETWGMMKSKQSNWLVLELPLWKIWLKVSWDDEIPYMMGKIKFMFQSTNQYINL